jgi:hypothetical protein
MKDLSVIEEPNVRLAKLDSVGLVFIRQNRLCERIVHSHCTFLLPAPQRSLGDGSSLRCGGKGPAFTVRNCLHIQNLVGIVNALRTKVALFVRHIQILSTILLTSLPDSSNTEPGHSKLDGNSSNSATMQLAGR